MSFRDIEDAVGRDAAVDIALDAGGSSIYIPESPSARLHLPACMLPHEAALGRAFGGTTLYVPMANAECARVLAGRGVGHEDIRTRLRLSATALARILESGP